MNYADFLSELGARDIRVWAEGDRLRCSAAPDALTPELRAQLKERKADILAFLAKAAAAASKTSAIVPLQPRSSSSGSRPPIFAVPGHNGDVFCYRDLARQLGKEQPLFGLQPAGLEGDSTPFERVEDLAAWFARQVNEHSPQGPLVIAGFCAGGAVAFELAQQLRQSGREVSMVVLFGSPYPTFFGRPMQFREALWRRARNLGRRVRTLASLPAHERWGYLQQEIAERRARRQGSESAAAPDPAMVRKAALEEATVAAVRRYDPQYFPGRLCLFLPDPQVTEFDSRARNWCARFLDSRVHPGPQGCTSDNMLKDPQASFIARALEQDIEAPQPALPVRRAFSLPDNAYGRGRDRSGSNLAISR